MRRWKRQRSGKRASSSEAIINPFLPPPLHTKEEHREEGVEKQEDKTEAESDGAAKPEK